MTFFYTDSLKKEKNKPPLLKHLFYSFLPLHSVVWFRFEMINILREPFLV